MFESHLETCVRREGVPAPRTVAAAILVALCLAPTLSRGAEAGDAARADGLSDIGRDLEAARNLPAAQRTAVLGELSARLEAVREGVPSEDKAAVRYLSGEIRYAAGEYEAAARAFGDAAGAGERWRYKPDAEFLAAASLEAAGKDREAAAAWKRWEKENPLSPLRGEVRLARAWNALRLLDLKEAAALLEGIGAIEPAMRADPRVILAGSTLSYLQGRPEAALVPLGNTGGGPGTVFLRALCLARAGAWLKAAAQYQEIVERYPESPLHDPALLAKADIFLQGGAYKNAAEEMARVAESASDPAIASEAALRRAAAVVLGGDGEAGTALLRQVVQADPMSGTAARAQYLLGEALIGQKRYQEAVVELNRVLTDHFEHDLAPRAQFRIGRCLDALGRQPDATSTYQTVVSGYPQAPEAPAAAYLAGVGLLDQGRPAAAAPYFQLVLDRYARTDSSGSVDFASAEHRELVEASLCLLELSYHRAGDLGQLSGAPHLLLRKMPPSDSRWRAQALLIDADALASQARFEEAQAELEQLLREFPGDKVGVPANRLLAWTYARQGKDDLAIETEQRMLERYSADGGSERLGSAWLNRAHILFNKKDYGGAAKAYEEFLAQFPGHAQRLTALYQAGLCYLRLDRSGDAVDRFEALVAAEPAAAISERAWIRAGDTYFRADRFDDAERCYRGLLEHFSGSPAAALGALRLAQCAYNAGRDADALERFSSVAGTYPGTPEAKEASHGTEMALYRLGQSKGGTEVLASLVEQHPTSSFAADAQFQIASRLYDEKRFGEAAEAFRRVVVQFPGYTEADRAQFLMADACGQDARPEDARLGYEQFLRFFPESELRTSARFRLGMLRFQQEDYMQAAVDFAGVLETEAPDEVASAALFNLALCQRRMEQPDQARASLESYRKRFGDADARAAEVADQLGGLNELAGRNADAAAEFERAASGAKTPDLKAEALFQLGRCREQLGDADGALVAYRSSANVAGADEAFRLSALARTAALYEEKGQLDKALSAYQELLRTAKDPELVSAAKERVAQLQTGGR